MTGLRKRIVEIPEHEYVDLMITFVSPPSFMFGTLMSLSSDNVFVIKPRIDAEVVTD